MEDGFPFVFAAICCQNYTCFEHWFKGSLNYNGGIHMFMYSVEMLSAFLGEIKFSYTEGDNPFTLSSFASFISSVRRKAAMAVEADEPGLIRDFFGECCRKSFEDACNVDDPSVQQKVHSVYECNHISVLYKSAVSLFKPRKSHSHKRKAKASEPHGAGASLDDPPAPQSVASLRARVSLPPPQDQVIPATPSHQILPEKPMQTSPQMHLQAPGLAALANVAFPSSPIVGAARAPATVGHTPVPNAPLSSPPSALAPAHPHAPPAAPPLQHDNIAHQIQSLEEEKSVLEGHLMSLLTQIESTALLAKIESCLQQPSPDDAFKALMAFGAPNQAPLPPTSVRVGSACQMLSDEHAKKRRALAQQHSIQDDVGPGVQDFIFAAFGSLLQRKRANAGHAVQL